MTRWQYLLLFTVFLACAIQLRCARVHAPKEPEFEIIPLFADQVLVRRGNHDWQVSVANADQAIENIKATGSPWATRRIDAPRAPLFDPTVTSVDLTSPFPSGRVSVGPGGPSIDTDADSDARKVR